MGMVGFMGTTEAASCLIVNLDGCRTDYVSQETTPFLYHLKSTGCFATLDVGSSFYTPAEIATGNSSATTDTFFDFCFDLEESPFCLFRFARGQLHLKHGSRIRERIRRKLFSVAYSKMTRNWIEFPPNIPLALLSRFTVNPSQVSFNESERRLSAEHLLGILGRSGYDVHSVAERHLASFLRSFRWPADGQRHAVLLHYGQLDKVGHQFGPYSSEVNRELECIDASVEQVYHMVGNHVDFTMVFGDHDMEEVDTYIDLWEELKKLEATIPRDYLVFLNTPVARFWFNSDRARQEVCGLLEQCKDYGRVVSKSELAEREFPVHDKYGEVIFWLKRGVAINPDFYHEYPLRGMHFYFDTPGSTLLMLRHRDGDVKLRDRGKLRDVMPTILDLLNIRDSTHRDGTSLVLGEQGR